jgi:hypothetical protein
MKVSRLQVHTLDRDGTFLVEFLDAMEDIPVQDKL